MERYRILSGRRQVRFLAAALVCALLTGILVSRCQAWDKIIAVVNNDAITQKDFDDFVNFMRVEMARKNSSGQVEAKIEEMRKDLLDRLIEDRLILQEAKKNGIKIDQNRVKARVDEIRKRYNSERDFQAELAKQGMVTADIEAKIKEQMLMFFIVEQKVRSKIVVAPDEVTDFYQNNKTKFILSEQREIESLSTDKEAVIKDLYAKLQKGRGMEDLAKENSLRVNTFTSRKGELRPDIEAIVFKLQPGQIYAPAKIKDTYYIFRVNSIIPPRQQLLPEVTGEINKYLFDRKMQERLSSWLDEIKKRSYIKIITN
ncbi:MAG: SurA N-terminal domain-containing protein [Candidatus Omnitrophica bacterium]|nr:SurA N-terminal domain-containing protein [Candidatus Omnitrophota bacterium]